MIVAITLDKQHESEASTFYQHRCDGASEVFPLLLEICALFAPAPPHGLPA